MKSHIITKEEIEQAMEDVVKPYSLAGSFGTGKSKELKYDSKSVEFKIYSNGVLMAVVFHIENAILTYNNIEC